MHLARYLTVAALCVLALGAGLPSAAAAEDGPAATAEGTPAQARLVNINTANVEELQTLNGIGPALALRIVEYRQAHGPFERIEEIINVRGIGEKTFLRFKDRITVGQPADRES